MAGGYAVSTGDKADPKMTQFGIVWQNSISHGDGAGLKNPNSNRGDLVLCTKAVNGGMRLLGDTLIHKQTNFERERI